MQTFADLKIIDIIYLLGESLILGIKIDEETPSVFYQEKIEIKMTFLSFH